MTWITDTNNLPIHGQFVDIWTKGTGRITDVEFDGEDEGCFYDEQEFDTETYYLNDIIGWMTIPEPPQD